MITSSDRSRINLCRNLALIESGQREGRCRVMFLHNLLLVRAVISVPQPRVFSHSRHPQKSEIRFQCPSAILSNINSICLRGKEDANFFRIPLDKSTAEMLIYFTSVRKDGKVVRMNHPSHKNLSARERQIMDIVYARGSASRVSISVRAADPPSYSTSAPSCSFWRRKGISATRKRNVLFLYFPTKPVQQAAHSALAQSCRPSLRAISSGLSRPCSPRRYPTDIRGARTGISALVEQANRQRKRPKYRRRERKL